MSKPPVLSKRRQVRERVLQALYAYTQSGDEVDHVVKTLLAPTFADEALYLRFAEKLFLRSVDTLTASDALIEAHIQNWDIGRLALTDRLVLSMAIAEMLHFEDIPPKVSLNEAVEVAKAFGTDKSGAFVNGVLDAVLRDLRQSGRLHKSGRGLVETSADGEEA